MTDNLVDLSFIGYKIQTDILDAIPYAITVQNRERIVLYENKAAIEFLGSRKGEKCYLRWQYLDSYKNDVCEDCPGHVTLVDNISHKIVKQTEDPDGNQIILEISHIPLKIKDSFDAYIEIMRNITLQETQNVDLIQIPRDDISVSFTRFGTIGGHKIYSTPLSFIPQNQDTEFFIKMSAFWFAAIGQGHNWPEGLYGPLPVLDYTNYNSYAYPLKLLAKDESDDRMSGYDFVLCIVFINRFDKRLKANFDKFEALMGSFFSSIDELELLTPELAKSLKSELILNIPESNGKH